MQEEVLASLRHVQGGALCSCLVCGCRQKVCWVKPWLRTQAGCASSREGSARRRCTRARRKPVAENSASHSFRVRSLPPPMASIWRRGQGGREAAQHHCSCGMHFAKLSSSQ